MPAWLPLPQDALEWAGLIWALAMGWALSSYASCFIYRLPRGEYPFGRKPYCGECNAALQPKDLAPIFSYLATKGRCRYCGAAVPVSYFLIELFYTLFFGWCYLRFGFSDPLLVYGALGALLVSLAAMGYEDRYFSPGVTASLLLLGIITSCLQKQALADPLLHGFLGLMAGMALYKFRGGDPQKTEPRQWPPYLWLLTAAGAWLGVVPLLIFAAAWGAAHWTLPRIGLEAQRLSLSAYAALLLGFVLYALSVV